MASNGVDFNLPDEILAVIPADPYDQLDLARRITSLAISSRVSRLEAESDRLRQKIADRDRVIEELQDKLAHRDRLVQESDARLRATLEENDKLSRERDTLAMTSKKLARQLSKLETFKRHLMKSLDDENSPQQSEAVDTGTSYIQPIARISSWKDDGSISHFGLDVANGSAEMGDSTRDGSKHAMHNFSITPYITPRLTPTCTPKFSSTDGSPRGFSTGSSPRVLSGATSPTKTQLEERRSLSPWYASSQQSSASSSPPHRRPLPGRPPRIDGKEIFRQARSRLSYEQFAAFLANVKELNAQRQSREETLAKAEEIFGTEHKDLYLSFQSLLNRTLP